MFSFLGRFERPVIFALLCALAGLLVHWLLGLAGFPLSIGPLTTAVAVGVGGVIGELIRQRRRGG